MRAKEDSTQYAMAVRADKADTEQAQKNKWRGMERAHATNF